VIAMMATPASRRSSSRRLTVPPSARATRTPAIAMMVAATRVGEQALELEQA
jgi:hypothetical protein